jgi:cobalt/nickel transport system permease protein
MHLHIPDGVLPIWLWLAGFIVLAVFLIPVLLKIRKQLNMVPRAAMTVALILVIMSIPLGLPIHLNLLALAGILVGPLWSLVVAFLANLILALLGHGGLTIVGLNTLILWIQALAGFYLFKFFVKFLKKDGISAGLAAFIGLALSFLFTLFLIAISRVEPGEFFHLHEGAEEIGHLEMSVSTFLKISSPFILLGIVIESFVTAFVVQFIKKVKPDLLGKL